MKTGMFVTNHLPLAKQTRLPPVYETVVLHGCDLLMK